MVNLRETPIGKALQNINKETRKKLTYLFNTAYAVAKKGKPFSDYEYISALQMKNGVDLPKNYINGHGCLNFIWSIARVLQDEIKTVVNENRFVSVLADGSTHSSIKEQELIYLRFIDVNFRPITRLIDIVELGNANAAGVYEGIENGLGSINLNFEKLKPDSPGPSLGSANFDGASVMLGKRGGVIRKIKEVIPSALGIHCVAHKLELAVLNANKSGSKMRKFEDTLKGIFNFYHYSPKRRRELAEISNLFDTELARFSGVHQVRWMASKEHTVSALKKNLKTVVLHVEHRNVEGTRAEDANRAKAYHKHLTSVSFIKMLYFLLNFLPVLARLSKVFQREEILIFEIPDVVESAVVELSALKAQPGKC